MTSGSTPRRPRAVLAYGGAALVVIALAWVTGLVLLQIWLVTVAVAVALLLAALLEPVARRLRRWSVPAWAAALLCLLVLLAVPLSIGFLFVSRATAQLDDVGGALASGVDRLRNWLVTGPAGLSPEQVDGVRGEVVDRLREAVPTVTAGATTVGEFLGAVVVVAFIVFFVLKDGHEMWHWAVSQVAERHRDRLDSTGHAVWTTLTHYVAGTVAIALIDAAGIGIGLVLIGVPLALPLTLLVFLGGFVPLLGATVSGAVAILVALVTDGLTSALLVLGVVLLVQQLEGNLLQPLLMAHAVDLHPVVILLSVTTGGLLLGVAGAVIAVPLVAVGYTVVQSVREHRPSPEPSG